MPHARVSSSAARSPPDLHAVLEGVGIACHGHRGSAVCGGRTGGGTEEIWRGRRDEVVGNAEGFFELHLDHEEYG